MAKALHSLGSERLPDGGVEAHVAERLQQIAERAGDGVGLCGQGGAAVVRV
jgi:hypothetical protein